MRHSFIMRQNYAEPRSLYIRMACGTDVPIPNNWLMESMLRSWSTGQIEVWSEKDGNWRAQTGTVPTADIDSASVSVLVRVPRQAKCLLGFGEELFNRTVLNTGKSTPSFHSYDGDSLRPLTNSFSSSTRPRSMFSMQSAASGNSPGVRSPGRYRASTAGSEMTAFVPPSPEYMKDGRPKSFA